MWNGLIQKRSHVPKTNIFSLILDREQPLQLMSSTGSNIFQQ